MTTTSQRFVLWAPRLAGILLAGFFALFAFDTFDGGSFIEALPAFAIHLIPSLIVLGVVALAWRFKWIGAAGFTALAIGYAAIASDRIDWIAVISIPLLVVALLFFMSWRKSTGLAR